MTKEEKPTTSYSKTVKPQSPKIGKFGIGAFGSAKFSKEEGFTKGEKQTTSFTKQSKP